MKKTVELPEDYALVLQQVDENGVEDFNNLAESLRLDRKRLVHVVRSLRSKGLICISQQTGEDVWIRLSAKGRRLMSFMWPESQLYMA